MIQNADKLYAIAEQQQGYFTAGQAVKCGYPTSNHVYHLRTGAWKREYRGIYRLARFPLSDDAQYVLWTLWSRNRQGEPQGTYSHQTALALFDLSDVMPRRLHMTVPPGFRRTASVPAILVMHRGGCSTQDVESRHGYRVTRPLRTVTDLLATAAIPGDILSQALKQAIERGLISRADVKKNPQHKTLTKLLKGGVA